MRIGIDGRLWNETGVGRYIRNLVKELQVLDKKNEYVLFMRSKDLQQLTISNSQLTKNKNWKFVKVDIRWHTIEEQLKLTQILTNENLDLMHFPYFSIPVNYKKPYVITIHDLILNHFSTGKASTLPRPLYQLKRIGYGYVLSKAIRDARKIIVPLNSVKDDLVKTMKVAEDKIVVTYEGVDESLYSSSDPEQVEGESRRKILKQDPDDKFSTSSNNKYFLYVGNAYPHKNLENLIKAFSEFKKNKNDAELLLVGKKDYFYQKLKEKIGKENLDEIIIKHDISDQELYELYSNALAFISPSLMEGFGLPALEAMYARCLVLVSDIPSFREVCQDAAIYFDPNKEKDIAAKMTAALGLSNKSKMQFILKGQNRVKHFSWKKMGEKTIKIYESSVGL